MNKIRIHVNSNNMESGFLYDDNIVSIQRRAQDIIVPPIDIRYLDVKTIEELMDAQLEEDHISNLFDNLVDSEDYVTYDTSKLTDIVKIFKLILDKVGISANYNILTTNDCPNSQSYIISTETANYLSGRYTDMFDIDSGCIIGALNDSKLDEEFITAIAKKNGLKLNDIQYNTAEYYTGRSHSEIAVGDMFIVPHELLGDCLCVVIGKDHDTENSITCLLLKYENDVYFPYRIPNYDTVSLDQLQSENNTSMALPRLYKISDLFQWLNGKGCTNFEWSRNAIKSDSNIFVPILNNIWGDIDDANTGFDNGICIVDKVGNIRYDYLPVISKKDITEAMITNGNPNSHTISVKSDAEKFNTGFLDGFDNEFVESLVPFTKKIYNYSAIDNRSITLNNNDDIHVVNFEDNINAYMQLLSFSEIFGDYRKGTIKISSSLLDEEYDSNKMSIFHTRVSGVGAFGEPTYTDISTNFEKYVSFVDNIFGFARMEAYNDEEYYFLHDNVIKIQLNIDGYINSGIIPNEAEIYILNADNTVFRRTITLSSNGVELGGTGGIYTYKWERCDEELESYYGSLYIGLPSYDFKFMKIAIQSKTGGISGTGTKLSGKIFIFNQGYIGYDYRINNFNYDNIANLDGLVYFNEGNKYEFFNSSNFSKFVLPNSVSSPIVHNINAIHGKDIYDYRNDSMTRFINNNNISKVSNTITEVIPIRSLLGYNNLDYSVGGFLNFKMAQLAQLDDDKCALSIGHISSSQWMYNGEIETVNRDIYGNYHFDTVNNIHPIFVMSYNTRHIEYNDN